MGASIPRSLILGGGIEEEPGLDELGAFAFSAGGVAVDAVFEGVDLVLVVKGPHLLLVMAGVAGVLGVGVFVAGLAGEVGANVGMVDQEGMGLEFSWEPGDCGVTAFALEAEEPGVYGGFFVAALAVLGSASEGLVVVASTAGQVGVFAIEGVDLGVFEVGVAVVAVMAFEAVRAEGIDVVCQLVMVFSSVAGDAVQGVGGEAVLAVAALTRHQF